MSTKLPSPEYRSDELIVVPVNSIQYAEWGQTVELYARVINLTMRDLRISGATWNLWQRSKKQTPDEMNKEVSGFPYAEIPRMFVSPPHLIATLELNPDNFDVGIAQYLTFSYQLSYESTPGKGFPCERATWHLGMPKKT